MNATDSNQPTGRDRYVDVKELVRTFKICRSRWYSKFFRDERFPERAPFGRARRHHLGAVFAYFETHKDEL